MEPLPKPVTHQSGNRAAGDTGLLPQTPSVISDSLIVMPFVSEQLC
jgi:hypothetical protein